MVEHSKVQELESDLSEILSLEGFEGRWRVTTADERVERVGCIVRRLQLEEGLLY